MTAPALPGAAPDPAPGRNDAARLPPEVERALMAFARTTTLTPESVEAVAALRAAIMDAMRAASVASGAASPAAGASARALGGDGEPVAWRRGHRPVGNRAEVEVCETSDLDVDDVIFHDGAWYVVLDSDESDATQVWAAPIVDDAGGQDEPEFCYGEFFVRCVPTRPAATGDTVGAAARALVKAAIDARADEAVTGIIVPEAEWDALLAALRSTPGGGACG